MWICGWLLSAQEDRVSGIALVALVLEHALPVFTFSMDGVVPEAVTFGDISTLVCL